MQLEAQARVGGDPSSKGVPAGVRMDAGEMGQAQGGAVH